MSDNEVSALIRIEGGIADDGRLDLHDAAGFITGLARAINITAHAFANDGDLRKKAQGAHGAKTYLHSSRKGCFEEQVDIVFDDQVVADVGRTVLRRTFWDFLTVAWSAAIGRELEPETRRVQDLLQRNDVFVDEIADLLESPLRSLHKALEADRSMIMILSRPRGDDVLKFTSESLDFVTTRDEEEAQDYITGNVTRFNVISNRGRMYSDEDEKIVSFIIPSEDARMRGLAVESMKSKIEGEQGKLYFKANRIVSALGTVKRYIVHDIVRGAEQEKV